GYYWDAETNYYFLQTRYYSPEWRRFLNADSLFIAGGDMLNGGNMYAYCNGNPVMYADPSGRGIICDFITRIAGKVQGFFEGLFTHGFIGSIANKIESCFGGISGKVQGFFSGFFCQSRTGGFLDGIAGRIDGFFGGIASRISGGISGGIQGLFGGISGRIFSGGLFSGIGKGGAGLFGGGLDLGNIGTRISTGIGSFLDGIFGPVVDFLDSSLGWTLITIGSLGALGFVGMFAMFNGFLETAGGLSGLLGFASDVLGLFAPIFAFFGRAGGGGGFGGLGGLLGLLLGQTENMFSIDAVGKLLISKDGTITNNNAGAPGVQSSSPSDPYVGTKSGTKVEYVALFFDADSNEDRSANLTVNLGEHAGATVEWRGDTSNIALSDKKSISPTATAKNGIDQTTLIAQVSNAGGSIGEARVSVTSNQSAPSFFWPVSITNNVYLSPEPKIRTFSTPLPPGRDLIASAQQPVFVLGYHGDYMIIASIIYQAPYFIWGFEHKNYFISWPIEQTTPGSPGLKGRNINSFYGYRERDDIYSYHDGVDTPARLSTDYNDPDYKKGYPVQAIMSGTVLDIGRHIEPNGKGRGRYIVLEHKRGGSTYYTMYQHLEEDTVLVSINGTVYAGQPIATSGESGSENSLHLHFSVYRNKPNLNYYLHGDFINPIDYYNSNDFRSKYSNPNPMFVYKSNFESWVFNSSFDWSYGNPAKIMDPNDKKREKYFTGWDKTGAKEDNDFSIDNTTSEWSWTNYNPYS
ncbi:MAG: peptidoglycan DD-metalloendopeptidase family protein, partial [Oscillospiraceae bacterium]|nr:peptidoglycan DD-metalloendopeptidase family protein [Oscillospiraceae bacterium]